MFTYYLWKSILTEKKYFNIEFIMPKFSEIVFGCFASIFTLFLDILLFPLYLISVALYLILKGVIK